ncbi:MAG: hypothetical protein A2020_09410 [Lentisphaerae bacterium GWF2_45_14]|nr:MAG: hypothetical protein A2020_09410 [Lentisphaerae bacterium GWF2_45_14]
MFSDNLQIALFSKCVQGYPLGKLIDRLQRMEIKHLDITVRPGGHVEPEKVEDQLPEIHEILLKAGISINMLTTNILDAADRLTVKILKSAAALGIKYYKLGYYTYEGFGTLSRQRDDVKKRVEELSRLNTEMGLHGGFHNHSENFFGASLWDIHYVIKDTSPVAIGVYFDPAHAVIEGGSSGWKMGMDLLADRITMLAVKDFRWLDNKNGYAGARRHSIEICPLEDGNVPWPDVLQILKKINFKGPVSLHSEYKGAHSFRDLNTEEVFEQTGKDLAFFRKLLNP